MGQGLVFLSEPNQEKITQTGEELDLNYAATSMQGWRINMEDAHCAIPNFGGDPKAYLFCVFDGHGGNFQAK